MGQENNESRKGHLLYPELDCLETSKSEKTPAIYFAIFLRLQTIYLSELRSKGETWFHDWKSDLEYQTLDDPADMRVPCCQTV